MSEIRKEYKLYLKVLSNLKLQDRDDIAKLYDRLIDEIEFLKQFVTHYNDRSAKLLKVEQENKELQESNTAKQRIRLCEKISKLERENGDLHTGYNAILDDIDFGYDTEMIKNKILNKCYHGLENHTFEVQEFEVEGEIE